MVRYRRNRVPGGTYFFTVTLKDRRDDALVRHIDLLRVSWRCALGRIPHDVIAVVADLRGLLPLDWGDPVD